MLPKMAVLGFVVVGLVSGWFALMIAPEMFQDPIAGQSARQLFIAIAILMLLFAAVISVAYVRNRQPPFLLLFALTVAGAVTIALMFRFFGVWPVG